MKTNSYFRLALFVFAFCVLFGGAKGQTTQPTPDTDVVKITTKLVQLDVLVTDKNGRQVKDLRPQDLEVYQDGKLQKITNLTYIDRGPKTTPQILKAISGTPMANTVPAPRISSSEARRVITFVVDDDPSDCKLKVADISSVRIGLEKFIREQMEPTDLVAIYRTRSGSSLLQQYTNDKNLLLKIAANIKYTLPPPHCIPTDPKKSLSGIGMYPDAGSNAFSIISAKYAPVSMPTPVPMPTPSLELLGDLYDKIKGKVAVLRYAINGLSKIPGRKIVILLSQNMPVVSEEQNILQDNVNILSDLIEFANRSSVSIYSIFSAGIYIPAKVAADAIPDVKSDIAAGEDLIQTRIRLDKNAQDGLKQLADKTGGKFKIGNGQIDDYIQRAVEAESGYYLIAYEPDEGTFKNKKFNKLNVKSKIPGLQISSRSGFWGVTDAVAKLKPKPRSADSDLYEALISPMPTAGLNVGLTAYFANSPEANNFVRSIFHLDGNGITLVDDANGTKKLMLDVIAVTLNEKNERVDEFSRTHTVKFDANTARLIQERGLVYSADVPVKKPGTYTFRVAVRDGNSRSLGSASQVVTVPDLTKPETYMSGLFVTNVDSTGAFTKPTVPTAETAISLPLAGDVPAIRKFQRGKIIAYNYDIYNAKIDAKLGRPRLSAKVNLYKDGVLIAEGQPDEIDLKDQKDLTHIENFSYLQLQKNADLGEYALQIIITDLVAGSKSAVSSQWIDFEVID